MDIPFGCIPTGVKELLDTEKQVILYGSGGSGKDALAFLNARDIEVLFFCDSDPSKLGKTINGVPINTPEMLVSHKEKTVLISSDYCREIGDK